MDYSLFLIVLQIPKSDDPIHSISLNLSCKELDLKKTVFLSQVESQLKSSVADTETLEKRKKEQDLLN